jgi:fused signal recognition particle receptor
VKRSFALVSPPLKPERTETKVANIMFGWGKKKESEAVLTDRLDGPVSSSPAPLAPFPAAVYVAVAHDPEQLDGQIVPLVQQAAGCVTGVATTQSASEGAAIAVTMLVEPGSDAELVFISARAGGLKLASALDGLAQLFVVRSGPAGEALETYRIDPPPPEEAPAPADVIDKLVDGLSRSSSKLAEGLASVFTKDKLDSDTLDELEELLITSDIGAPAAARIRAGISKDRFDRDIRPEEIRQALASEITAILAPYETNDSPFERISDGPRVILFVGVNGSGKTTTIGKIAHNLAASGHKVILAAGDTFRAAAVEQLKVWGDRAGVPVVSRDTGADAAGLAYDALAKAKSEGADVLLIDTAGRLQNKVELMSELSKLVRVIKKLDPDAPHETWLVLDATVGQNALSQTEAFRHTAGITGLVMTKLDGTAKGGVLVAVTEKHKLPIRFIGVGEKAEDLQPFSATAFAHALVGLNTFTSAGSTQND